MNYQMYIAYIEECKDLGSAEQLLGQIGFPPDMELTAEGLATACEIIAAAAESDVKRLISIAKLNIIRFANKYGIPYRTVQDWCYGARKPADYLVILIGFEMITELPKENLG